MHFVYRLLPGTLLRRVANARNDAMPFKFFSLWRDWDFGRKNCDSVWKDRCARMSCTEEIWEVTHAVDVLIVPYKNVSWVDADAYDRMLGSLLLQLDDKRQGDVSMSRTCFREAVMRLVLQEEPDVLSCKVSETHGFTVKPDIDLVAGLCEMGLNGYARFVKARPNTPPSSNALSTGMTHCFDEVAICGTAIRKHLKRIEVRQLDPTSRGGGAKGRAPRQR
jgi:hypothetical protein